MSKVLKKIVKQVMRKNRGNKPITPTPAVLSWLEKWPGKPWLLERATALLQSGDPLDPVVAAGFVSRHWTPLTSEGKALLAQELLKGGKNPMSEAVSNFARGISNKMLGLIEAYALDNVEACREDVDNCSASFTAIESELPASDYSPADHADYLRVNREKLECIYEVLWTRKCGEALRRALDSLDELAEDRLMLIDDAGTCQPQELASVSWHDPDAWWGVVPQ